MKFWNKNNILKINELQFMNQQLKNKIWKLDKIQNSYYEKIIKLRQLNQNLYNKNRKLEKIQKSTNEKIDHLKNSISMQTESLQAKNKIMDQINNVNFELKDQIRKQDEKLHSIKKINSRLNQKVKNLKKYRDYFIQHPSAVETMSNSLLYNQKASMNAFYCNETNVKKYYSDLQIQVYNIYIDILAELPFLNYAQVLDACCGLGIFAKLLKENFRSNAISGFDFSEIVIRKAQKLLPQENFFVHDICKPLEEKYTLITCTESLEHIEKPEIALINLINSIALNGVLFITVPDGRIDTSTKHINFWSPESWNCFIRKIALHMYFKTDVAQHKEVKSLRYNYAILSQKKYPGLSSS